MNIDDFIKNFAAQMDGDVADSITPQTVFTEMAEWDSMIALSVMAMVDEKYGVIIEARDIRKGRTIEELFNTVRSQKCNV
jgi:acyl carrier protein